MGRLVDPQLHGHDAAPPLRPLPRERLEEQLRRAPRRWRWEEWTIAVIVGALAVNGIVLVAGLAGAG